MNKIDEFWFWTMKAIAVPNDSDKVYYYDTLEDVLFGVKRNIEKYSPILRNEWSKTPEIEKKFDAEILKVKKSNSDIIVLPKLSYEEKLDFLFSFIKSIDSLHFRKILEMDVNVFSPSDEFGFQSGIKSLDKNLSLKFELDKGIFCAKKVNEYFVPLGVSDMSTFILW